MAKTLVLAEKPSVAREVARGLGCKQAGEERKQQGFFQQSLFAASKRNNFFQCSIHLTTHPYI